MKMTSRLIFLLLIIFVYKLEASSTYDNNKSIGFNSSAVSPCSQKTSLRHRLLAFFCITVLLIGIIGNLISIILIHTSSHLQKFIAFTFVKSLAVADLGVSIFVTTVKVDNYLNNGSYCHGFALCVFFHLTDTLFPITSICHLVVICIDRWYAITCPYSYVANMNKTKARLAIAGIWIYSLLWTLLGVFSWENPTNLAYKINVVGKKRFCYSLNKYYHTAIVFIIYILPMTVVTWLYFIILRIALKQAASDASLQCKTTCKTRKKRIYADAKAAKTVATVFLAYTICWLPLMVIVIIQYWNQDLINEFLRTNEVAYDVTTTVFTNILPTFNSCINPFIYFIVGTQFRSAFQDMYCKLLGKPRCRGDTFLFFDWRNVSVIDKQIIKTKVEKHKTSTKSSDCIQDNVKPLLNGLTKV